MISKRESIHIGFAIIIMSIVINFVFLKDILSLTGILRYLEALGYSIIIILTAVFARKLTAKKQDIKIEHKILGLQRWGIWRKAHFKKPIPLGVILPLFLTAVSTGTIKCFTLLQFESEALISKVTKSKGGPNVRTSGINESDLGIIVFWGFITTLALALIADYTNFLELARFSIYYVMWNLIPFGQLDGMKLLMSAGQPIHGSSKFEKPVFPIAALYFFTIIITIITAIIVLF